MKHDRCKLERATSNSADKSSYREFAAPFWVQLLEVQKRVFEQYWRTPSYIYSKLLLVVCSVSLNRAESLRASILTNIS